MNDFTKEELEDIYWHFSFYLECLEPNFGKCKSIRRTELMNKIQSLIDNYCEHESDGYAYYKSGIKCTDFLLYASSDSACLLKCKKCSELFDDGRP